MRHGRAKAARKTLQFFTRRTGIKAPYTVVLDGTFVVAVASVEDFGRRLDKLLQHAAHSLAVLQSTVQELENLKAKTKNAKFEDALRWIRDQQVRILDSIPPEEQQGETIAGLSQAAQDVYHLAHESKHIFCSQDETLLDCLRQLTVPIVRWARASVLLLEQPRQTMVHAQRSDRTQFRAAGLTDQEAALIQLARAEQRAQQRASHCPAAPQRRKRKAKGPNPLSCKKPKKENSSKSGTKKRKSETSS